MRKVRPEIDYVTNHMLEVAYVMDKWRCSRPPCPQACCGSSSSRAWVASDEVTGHMLEVDYVMGRLSMLENADPPDR